MLEADADLAGAGMEGEVEAGMGSRDLNAEVIRLTLELQEATEEKLQAARYGLVVLEESAALKVKHRQLEEEHEVLKVELQQLKEVGMFQVSQLRIFMCLDSKYSFVFINCEPGFLPDPELKYPFGTDVGTTLIRIYQR